MQRALRWYDLITLNIYFTGLTALSQTMTPLVLPLLVQRFVGGAAQGQFYGSLRLWGLMTAVLVQAVAGTLSDRSRLRWGRRRPFILTGTLLDLACLALIGYTATLEGMGGYRLLFVGLILLMVSTNIAHGPQQGLIPDLVPVEKRGQFSGVKALMEVPIPLMLVAFTIGPLVGNGRLEEALLVLGAVLLVTMGITMLAPEKRPSAPPPPFPRETLLRLAGMTTVFTLVILGSGALTSRAARLLETVSLRAALWGLGSIGLLAMSAAIGLGVWFSLHIGLDKRQRSGSAFTWWVVNRLAFLTATTNLAGFTLYFFQGRLGYAGEGAAIPASRMLLLVGAFILVSVLPAGYLSDRWGDKALLVTAGGIAALGTATLLSVPRLEVVYAGAILLGIASGIFYASNWALGTRLVPPGEEGRYLGISNLAGAGAGAVGAYIGGPIADYFAAHYPANPAIGYMLLFVIYGILFLLSVGAALPIASGRKIAESGAAAPL